MGLSRVQASALALVDGAYERERASVRPTSVPLAMFLAWDEVARTYWDVACQAIMGKAL